MKKLLFILLLAAAGAMSAGAAEPYAADSVRPGRYEKFEDPGSGKWGYKLDGRVVIPAVYDWAGSFHDGLARVEANGKEVFINESGKVVIPLIYDRVWPFSYDRAMVKINGKRGYIDRSGKLVVPAKYDDAGSFTDGRASVELNGRTFTIDRSGREIQ